MISTQMENITLLDQTFCRYDLSNSFLQFISDPCCNPYLWVSAAFPFKEVSYLLFVDRLLIAVCHFHGM